MLFQRRNLKKTQNKCKGRRTAVDFLAETLRNIEENNERRHREEVEVVKGLTDVLRDISNDKSWYQYEPHLKQTCPQGFRTG